MTGATTIGVRVVDDTKPKMNMVSDASSQSSLDRSIALFQKSLDKIVKHGKTSSVSGESLVTMSCIITLCKVVDNMLLERQYNPKTRSIKLGNKLFRDRVGSVPGGVDYLLACNFKYVRIASKTPVKKNPNGSIPGNAIKLLKENESRAQLVMARRYLQEYGARVMKIKPGKHRNELPPYIIEDDISEEVLTGIKENVDRIVYEQLGRIENLESIEEHKSHTGDYSTASSVMTPMSQTFDTSESAPPSPYSNDTNDDEDNGLDDEMSLSSAISYGTRKSATNKNSMEDQKSADTNESLKVEVKVKDTAEGNTIEKTPEKIRCEFGIPDEISPLVPHTPNKNELDMLLPLNLSPLSPENLKVQLGDDDSPSSVVDSDIKLSLEDKMEQVHQSLEDRLVEGGTRYSKFAELDGDDQSLASQTQSSVSLTSEEVDALKDITKCQGFKGTDDEHVLSIATGNLDAINSKEAGSLFNKLNKLACKKKASQKDGTRSDQKTMATECTSSSQIRIKSSDRLSVGGSICFKGRGQTKSINKSQDNEQTEKLRHHDKSIETGLKLFFAIIVVLYNFEDDFVPCEKENISNDSNAQGPWVPVEIVYKLWAALLRSERSFNNVDGREMYKSFLEMSKSSTKNQSGTDRALLLSLGDHDTSTCRYIVRSLSDAALVHVSNISLDLHQSVVGGKNSQHRMAIGVRQAGLSYGLELAQKSLNIQYESFDLGNHRAKLEDKNAAVEKLRKKCHSIISRSLLENIDFESTDKMFIDQNIDFDLLTTWYIIRWLPYHLLSANMRENALKLLVDKRFVQVRLESNGFHNGTVQYIRDCQMIQSLSSEEDDAQSVITTDELSARAVIAVYDAVHSFLNEIRKGYSLNFGGKENILDLANALHDVAIVIGEVQEDRRPEIDILNEALRFRIAGNDDKLLIAETQLQLGSCFHSIDPLKAISCYGEALRLTIDVHGNYHIGLSKILYHMGVLYCEEMEHDPSLECFVRALNILQTQEDQSLHFEDVAKIYSWIGNVNRERGDSCMALSYFQKALQTLESFMKTDNLEVAEILQNIGIAHDDLEKDEESLRALYECLRIRRKLLGIEFHHDVCETIGCIANVYRRSDVDKSLRLFRIVLNTRTDDPDKREIDEDVLRCHQNMLEVAKQKLQTSRGDDDLHFEIATLYFRIGSLLERFGRYTAAIENYLKSLEIRKLKGDYHAIGDLLNSLGIAHAKRQSYKKALKCFSDSLRVRRTVRGPQHEDVGETLHNMGNCAAKQNDFDRATEYYEKSLIIKRLSSGNESVSTANTLHKIGMINEELGLLSDSLNYYKDALAIRTSVLGKRHIDVAFSLHSIGGIYKQTNVVEKAIQCLRTSLRLKRKHYIGGHLSIAETMNLLAESYTTAGKVDEAVPLLEETLVIYEKRFGAHITTASVLDSLGVASLSKRNLELSHSYLERALAIKRLVYGDGDFEVSNTLFYIGKVQSKSGDLIDALETFKEVLQIRKKTFGDDSTEVAAIINDVGVIQLRRGRNDVARNCFLEAQRVWKEQGAQHKEYLGETLVNLGEIHHLEREYDDAITNFNEAIEIFESLYGNTHLSIAVVQYKLGKSLKERHEYDMAMTAFERALSIRSNELGDQNMLVAEVLKDLGALCLILGDLMRARNYIGEALDTMKSKKPNGLATAEAYYQMGKVMMKMKYEDEAFEAFSSALKIKRRRLEEDDLEVADMLNEMGHIYEDRHQWQNSVESFVQSLKIREQLLGVHELVAECHFSIGAVHQAIRKYHKALSNYGSALVIYQKALGDDHIACAKTMNNIGIVYEGIEEYNEALKYHKESLRIRKLCLGKDHIKIANSLDNIAGIYQRQQESDQALQSLKESLKIRSRFGTDNLDVATTLFGMGIIYVDKGDSLKALECYESALEIRKQKGKEFEVAQTLYNIGSLWAMQQDYKKALKHWQRALQIYKRTLDSDHHMIACTLGNIKMAENMLEEEINF